MSNERFARVRLIAYAVRQQSRIRLQGHTLS
jgi:hypothetical protein